MDDPKPTKRRWFRFSLRTLLVVVTFCGFLGWVGRQWLIVRERQTFLPKILIKRCDPVDMTARVPFYRRWIGDEGISMILVKPEDQETAAKLFPEAAYVVSTSPEKCPLHIEEPTDCPLWKLTDYSRSRRDPLENY